MNINTRERAEIVPCNNLFSSHHQSLMSEIFLDRKALHVLDSC